MKSEKGTGGSVTLVDLPTQPVDVAWPTEQWPTGPIGEVVSKPKKFAKVLDIPFGNDYPEALGLTRALVVIHRGVLVAERYGPGFHSGFDELAGRSPAPDGPDTKLTSWSMAKSMLQIAIGIAVRTQGLRVERHISVPQWVDQDDPRHDITWHHLLHMASGLSWIEEYVEDRGSDVINMLFGEGHHDMAAYAASFPSTSRPGSQFLYSSGTSNILARALQSELGLAGDEAGMRAWLRAELFDPIGMVDTDPQFDEAGTWVASSYVDATARDFARFGLLALRGGTWDGRTIVDRSWIDDGRTPIPLATNHANRYGAHWWVHDDGLGTFAAHGYEGQRITCVPAKDLVIVRLGKSPTRASDRDQDPQPVDTYIDKVIASFS